VLPCRLPYVINTLLFDIPITNDYHSCSKYETNCLSYLQLLTRDVTATFKYLHNDKRQIIRLLFDCIIHVFIAKNEKNY
jgi:hypothetical protein